MSVAGTSGPENCMRPFSRFAPPALACGSAAQRSFACAATGMATSRIAPHQDQRAPMASLDTVSIGILLGALLVLAGILSSLVAMRFGAPLLLVFLIIGMLAGEAGPGGIKFDDIRSTYMVGSIALALILFDGGLRTRFAAFRSVLGPALTLATIGVLLTAALTAPVAKFALGMTWVEALLLGAVVASTDAAAVFFLIHARGLR